MIELIWCNRETSFIALLLKFFEELKKKLKIDILFSLRATSLICQIELIES